MKLNIKQYKYEKLEIETKEIDLPTEVSYYFETGLRRSIKITPVFTTWNKEKLNKEEEIYCLEIVCVYNSFECRAEKFTINTTEIEVIFYSENHEHKRFVNSLVNNLFRVRTRELFEEDFNYAFNKMKS